MAIRFKYSVDLSLYGDDLSLTAVIDLAIFPVAIPFGGRLPNRLIVESASNTMKQVVVSASLLGSVATLTFSDPVPSSGIGLKLTMEFDQ